MRRRWRLRIWKWTINPTAAVSMAPLMILFFGEFGLSGGMLLWWKEQVGMSGGPGAERRGSAIDWTELPRTLTKLRVKNEGTESGNLLIVENRVKTIFFGL